MSLYINPSGMEIILYDTLGVIVTSNMEMFKNYVQTELIDRLMRKWL